MAALPDSRKRRADPVVAAAMAPPAPTSGGGGGGGPVSDEELARRLHEELNANVARLSRRSSQQLDAFEEWEDLGMPG